MSRLRLSSANFANAACNCESSMRGFGAILVDFLTRSMLQNSLVLCASHGCPARKAGKKCVAV
eukprot:4910812-Alexandrium_andersonii.AAC.1